MLYLSAATLWIFTMPHCLFTYHQDKTSKNDKCTVSLGSKSLKKTIVSIISRVHIYHVWTINRFPIEIKLNRKIFITIDFRTYFMRVVLLWVLIHSFDRKSAYIQLCVLVMLKSALFFPLFFVHATSKRWIATFFFKRKFHF